MHYIFIPIIRCEETKSIVAPEVAQALIDKVSLVDVVMHWH